MEPTTSFFVFFFLLTPSKFSCFSILGEFTQWRSKFRLPGMKIWGEISCNTQNYKWIGFVSLAPSLLRATPPPHHVNCNHLGRFILSVTAFALAFGKVIISAFDVAHKLSFFVWVPNCPRTFSPQCNVSLWNSMCSLKTLSEVMYLPHKSQSKCVERESRRYVALWVFHINL